MRFITATGLICVLCIAGLLQGCGANREIAPDARPGLATGMLAGFPALASLREVSAAYVNMQGKDYSRLWSHSRVAPQTESARFTPVYAGENRHFTDAAFAIYPIDVTDYTGTGELFVSFDKYKNAYEAWVGVADYTRGRWDWHQMGELVDGQYSLALSFAGRAKNNVMPVALVFTGTDTWDVASLSIGRDAHPGIWPMAGQNANHTYRTDELGPAEGNVLWTYRTIGSNQTLTGLAAGEDGTGYAMINRGIIAYDIDGRMKWETYGINCYNLPAITSDGKVYISGTWPHGGLHALNPQGEHMWTYSTQDDCMGQPAISPDGFIYFGCMDHMLYCMTPNGSLRWRDEFPIAVNNSPGVAPDGTVYVAYHTAEFAPKFRLRALSPIGEHIWDVEVGTPSRTTPKIAPNGNIYICVKSGQVVVRNSAGEFLWSVKGNPPYAQVVLDQDGILYCCSDALYSYDLDGNQRFRVSLGSLGSGSCTINPNGVVVVSTSTGYVLGFDEAGSELWRTKISQATEVAPVATGDMVYAADTDGIVYGLHPDGTMVWQVGTGGMVAGSPVTAQDGTIYFGCEDANLYALWPDGRLRWRFKTGGGISASPYVMDDGTILVGSKDNNLYAVSPAGQELWRFETGNFVECCPSIAPDGAIYFGSNDYNLYVLNPDHTLRWKYETGWKITGSPTIDTDGKSYVASWDYNIYCFTPEGDTEWIYLTDGPVKGSIALQDNLLWAACERDSYTGKIYCLNKDGTKKWSYITGGQVSMAPTIGADNSMYVATTYRENLKESGISAYRDGKYRWHFTSISEAQGMSMDGSATLYAGTSDGHLAALHDTGDSMEILWDYYNYNLSFYTPCISNGRVYVGFDRGIYCFGE